MLLGLLYRIIGDFFSYIGDIGDTPTPAVGGRGRQYKSVGVEGDSTSL